jgi:uncharacterized protein Veg
MNNREEYSDISGFDEMWLVKYYNKDGNKFTYGIKLVSGQKTLGCKLFKEKIEKDIVKNYSTVFLTELENFSDNKGNDTYQASFGHDDVVMAQMQIVFVLQTSQFKYLLDDLNNGNTISSNDDENFYDPYAYNPMYNSYYNIRDLYAEEQNNNLSRLNRF